MTFTYSIKTKTGHPVRFGNYEVSFGTFTNASGDTGGDIATGLSSVNVPLLTLNSTAVSSNAPAVTSISGGTVSIITDDNVDGYFLAIKTS